MDEKAKDRARIDSDHAAGMVESGFHVFIDNTDSPLTYDMVFGYHREPFNFDNHTFTAPNFEVAQYDALETLCASFDSFNDDVKSDIGMIGMSLEDYAYELRFDDWRDTRSEWQNIRASILSGETEYLRGFLDEVSEDYPSRAADLLEELNRYESTYPTRSKAESIPQTRDTERGTTMDELERISGQTAASMFEHGFEVFKDGAKIDRFDEFERSDDGFNSVIIGEYSARKSEIALHNVIEDLDSLNDLARLEKAETESVLAVNLRDYADEMRQSGKCAFNWNSDKSDWNNISASILSGDTEYIHAWLDDFPENLPYFEENQGVEVAAFRNSLRQYEEQYAENIPQPENYQPGRTFAYDMGNSVPFTVVHLDIGTEMRKNAVSSALKNIIDAYTDANGRTLDTAQPYKNLLRNVKPGTEFLSATQGHLSCLKYALRNALENKELCAAMLDGIKHAEKNLTPVITIKGYECIPRDNWEENGVSYSIGQSVDDMSFFYARAADGKVTWDYKYDHKPDRDEVMSDHADKLAEENISKSTVRNGINPKRAEPIPQPRDSSHNSTNAVPTARRGESRGKAMENTKFEMSSISKLEGDGKAKAIGTLVVNGEFAIHGVRVMEGGKNGLYASMPFEKDRYTGEYKDVVFPVTKEARAAIDDAVLGAYEKLMASPEKTLKNNVETPENTVSKVYAQMHEVNSDKTQTKAAGQITIDDCIVVTGVKVNEGVNQEGQKKTFVSMPGKPNETGGFDNIANPITKDFHNKVEKSVIASANNIGRYEYKGVKYEELGENPAKSAPLHPKFADKLMAELDKKGIPYQAKCAEMVTISVKASDKQAFETERKDLVAKLNGKDKQAPAQTQEKKTGTHSRQ